MFLFTNNLLDQEEGSSDGKTRYCKEIEKDVLEGRSRQIYWRYDAKTFVLWKTWNWQNRSSLRIACLFFFVFYFLLFGIYI